ncbi:MAG: hypothetical protein PHY29_03115 [Syntrophales bacterium]|nr:hypothetical protein [Syntrophales bacterium]
MAIEKATEQANATQAAAPGTPEAMQDEHAAREEVARAFGVQVPEEEQPTGQETEETGQETQQQGGDEGTEPEVAEEHKLQSWMGRKLAEHKREVNDTIQNTLAQFFNGLQGNRQPQETAMQPVQTIMPEGIDPNSIPTTAQDILDLMARRDTAMAQQERMYWTGYQRTLGQLANHYQLNPDQVRAVQAEMDALGHQRHNQDPGISAQINFQQALISSMVKTAKTAKPNVPVKGEAPISPTGIGTSQKTDQTKTETIQADANTRRILNSFDLSDEFLADFHKKTKG